MKKKGRHESISTKLMYQAPPYCQYEYQGQGQPYPQLQNQVPPQMLLQNLNTEDYSRKRGLEQLTSPYKGINQQREKKQKGGSPEVYYDMDAGIVQTEQPNRVLRERPG